MTLSRRGLMTGATAAAAAGSLGALPAYGRTDGRGGRGGRGGDLEQVERRIKRLFKGLPGDLGMKVVAPGRRGLWVEHNASRQLFVGSAIKTFILGEALRQADGPDVVQTITGRELDLDASVWSASSQIFNPPHLTGKVSERTAHEAMILHSDNTGTDMALKQAGPDNVRRFIRDAGLTKTRIPDSTRIFFGYILGAADYETFTWEQLVNDDGVYERAPLNKVQTLASSADDMVSYYSRALRGRFFEYDETLAEYRRVLSLADAIWLVPLPLGVSAFLKAGSIDIPGFHALSVPGGMFFEDRWVFFSFTYNWYAADEQDPAGAGRFIVAVAEALAAVKEALSD